MTEEKRTVKRPHNLILENRNSLTLSGISEVGSFDEQVIIVNTDIGELTIKGENLHINKLSIETGDLTVDGNISQLFYSQTQTKNGSFLSRLLR